LEQGPAGGGEGEFRAGEWFPRVEFILTNLETDSRAMVGFYNKRGTAEQWIREDKQAATMTRLSCHRFRSNEVRLWLSVIAYNLAPPSGLVWMSEGKGCHARRGWLSASPLSTAVLTASGPRGVF
jgi:hypothetical protein